MIYIWKHQETGEIREITCRISEIDDFLETVPDPEDWNRIPQLPNVRTDKLSVSFPDGHVPRSRKADLNDVKEATKLEIESYNKRPEDRAGLNKEIKKLKEQKK